MLAPVLIIIFAIAACLLQQWLSTAHGETNVSLIFDSGHYQQTAKLLLDFMTMPGDAAGDLKARLAQGLTLDGPALPGLGMIALLLFGRFGGLPDWQCFTYLQTMLHASAALLVYLLAGKITLTAEVLNEDSDQSGKKIQQISFGRRLSFCVGLAYALYPPAVLATQRFLIEPLAALLVLALVWLAQDVFSGRQKGKYLQSLGLGFVAAILIFTKTGLAPAVLLLLTIFASLCTQKALTTSGGTKAVILRNLFAVVCGFSVPFGAWAATTASLTGTAQLLPQRAPLLNLFVGSDLANDGFSTLPIAPTYPPIAQNLLRGASPPQAVIELWCQKPQATLSLTLRKLSRLCSLPWNDFRRPALGLNVYVQTMLHQFIFVLALAAICFACGRGASPAFWFAALIIFGHLVFLLFESIPRYGFSTYALLLLLASSLLLRLRRATPLGRVLVGAALIVIAQKFASFQNLLLFFIAPYAAFWVYALVLILIVASAAAALGRDLYLWSVDWQDVWQKASGDNFYNANKAKNLKKLGPELMAFAVGTMILIYASVIAALAFDQAKSAYWSLKIAPGQLVHRSVIAPDMVASNFHSARKSYLLIDGTRAIDQVKFKINGKDIDCRAVPLVDEYPFRLEHFAFGDQIVALMKRSPADIRRWWIVALPDGCLKPGQKNEIALEPQAEIVLYGDYAGTTRRPGFLYISPGAAWTNNKEFEFRVGPSFWQKPLATGEGGFPGKDKSWRIILAVEPEKGNSGQAASDLMPEADFESAGWYLY